MAGKKITVGTGMTAKSVMQYMEPFTLADIQALKEFSNRWNTELKEAGNEFGVAALDFVKQSRQIIEEAGTGPFEPDSSPHFAHRILQMHKIVQAAIDQNDADQAARNAFALGALCMEAVTKPEWEAHALRGRDNARLLNDESKKVNEARKKVRSAVWMRWNEEAALIWKNAPKLSKTSVANLIRKKLKLDDKIDTIAGRLTKPRRAR